MVLLHAFNPLAAILKTGCCWYNLFLIRNAADDFNRYV